MATYRRSFVFRLASDPVCYLWTGHGPLDTPGDAVDPSGARWLGAGHILDIPSLKALINGVAERPRFLLSGVAPDTSRLAMEDRDTVDGASVRIGYVTFDADWQLVGGITWDWLGIADALTVERSEDSRTIALSTASADTLRSNPVIAFYTDADQRKRSPTDAFCSHVAGITIGISRRFGPR